MACPENDAERNIDIRFAKILVARNGAAKNCPCLLADGDSGRCPSMGELRSIGDVGNDFDGEW